MFYLSIENFFLLVPEYSQFSVLKGHRVHKIGIDEMEGNE